MAMSRPESHDVPIAKQVKSGVVFCNSCHSFFFCIAHKHHYIKASPAWYAL
nr:MAG TPA: Cytochrome C' [Caudoviricetes sp.]